MSRIGCLAAVMATLYLQACASSGGVQRDDRDELTRGFLSGSAELLDPVSMRAFSPPAVSEPPSNTFSGALRLVSTAEAGRSRVVTDPWERVSTIGPAIRHLPEFDFRFVQRGRDVVPVRRGVIRRDHPYWEIILQPGKAWDEPHDGGWTRVALPFALQERSANCTHNGVLTWLFRDNGEVSRVAYQVSSETCGYFKLDMWGVVDAAYERQNLSVEAASAFQRLQIHRSNRLPVKPLEALAIDYPGTDPQGLGVKDGIPSEDISVLGVVVNGTHYRSHCRTRNGPHPFCASLPLPSYSTAKSIFAGVATMRLEKLYPGVSRATIASLVDECRSGPWRDVTVENALDMSTGNFESAEPGVDEDSAPHEEFVFSDNHADKLAFACAFFGRKAAPGTQFVYHTSDTYLVGAALQNFLRENESGADLYESVLVEPVWQQLRLSPLLDTTKRTYDHSAQPFTGYGLTYEIDDIVRIATWLQGGGFFHDGEAMLDRTLLDAALQRREGDRGVEAGSADLRYNNGFWAFNAAPSLGCPEPVWVPFMSGVSGITIAMFPNGVVYYYFSDSYVFRWQSARQAAHRISPIC